MKLRHFSISQQGDSHVATGKPCQDFSVTASVKNETLGIEMAIAAIADGVGSCDYSEDGSRIAVTTALNMLCQDLANVKEISEKTIPLLLKKAFQQAYDNIEKEADERELPFLLFDTTLTVTVLTEDGTCFIGHIGDDGVVALFEDGSYKMITNRIEGEEANSVMPLSSKENWVFSIAKKPVAAVALMTDGLLDKSVGSIRMNNRVYYPFFKPMFENVMESDQDVIDLRKYWDEYLHEKEFRAGYMITDDITLAIIQVPKILKKVKPAPFDEEKWNRETQKAREEIEKGLEESAASHEQKTPSKKQQTQESSGATRTQTNGCETQEGFQGGQIIRGSDMRLAKKESTNVQSSPGASKSQAPANPPIHRNNHSQNQYPRESAHVSEGSQREAAGRAGDHTLQQMAAQQRESIVRTSNSNEKDNQPKKNKYIVLTLICVVCLALVGTISGYIGYSNGKAKGQQLEQKISQQNLTRIQQNHEIEMSQEYDRGFRAGVDSVPTQAPVVSTTPAPRNISPEQYLISRGQKGQTVRFIQRMLIDKGWQLVLDGDFGEKTEAAVFEFQERNGLTATGAVDIFTFWMLMNQESLDYETQETETLDFQIADSVANDDGEESSESQEDKTLEQLQAIPEPTVSYDEDTLLRNGGDDLLD